MTNVVLCGGRGTRLWPISRALFPKQFYKFTNDNMSLFQKTVLRNKNFCDNFLIVTNSEQYFIALDQLEEIGIKNYRFVLEPVPRNTAAAISLACFDVKAGELLFVTPSDHLIKGEEGYMKMIKFAQKEAKDDYIVTFGIRPASAETGYGYIEADITGADTNTNSGAGSDLDASSGSGFSAGVQSCLPGNLIRSVSYRVASFKEKPDKETACSYISSGRYFWNSGMFMFKSGALLSELNAIYPTIYKSSKMAYENAKKDSMVVRVQLKDMMNIEENSIDFTLLEKTSRLKMIPAAIIWSDLGSFDSLYNEFEKDEHNNTIVEHSLNININSKNNMIISSGRLIATVDINDLIIVDTDDALLISKKGSSQDVKKVVEELKKRNSELHAQHLTAYRPWGTYKILLESSMYKIKKITVKPKAKLSLQKHFHRSEHWIVTSGTALVTVGDKKILLRSNESTYIPMGTLHRLENPGLIPLVLIEAQVGEYLKEDDIVRIDDEYDRMK